MIIDYISRYAVMLEMVLDTVRKKIPVYKVLLSSVLSHSGMRIVDSNG